MNVLRVTASMDPAMGGPPQGIRNSIAELERLGIRNEAVCCDAPDAAWLGKDSFPVHALGPGKYGFAYTPRLGPWLAENLPRFDAVIVHGLWLWPSVCAVRAVARHRRAVTSDEWRVTSGQSSERAQRKERKTGHGLGKISADGSERLAADRTGGNASSRVTSARGNLSPEMAGGGDAAATVLRNSKQLRCFVMPHGMLDPWFQRDKSRRVKAVRNWFYWWLIERGVVNSADAMLFTCQQELELARTTFGGYRPRREINVGYGIAEPPAFEPKMREAFAAKCPDLHGRPYLLFMSRIHAKKGVDLLVRAYARVRAEYGAWSREHGATERAEPKSAVADVDGRRQTGGFPDLVIAGPGWDSDYGRKVRGLIDEANRSIASAEHRTLNTEHSACVHAVAMLSGDAKWGALYGCEAFVLPSHQENFGIAVVEALACGKPVLISDQVNIWREIAEDGAGLVEADTEEGVEKLLRRFLAKGRRHEAKSRRHEAKGRRHEAEGIRQEAGGGPDGVACGIVSLPYAKASPPQAERAEGGGLRPEVGGRMEDGRWRMADGGGAPRECYLKRFAIGPAAAKLARALKS